MARGRESDLRTARAMRPARPCSRNHDAPGPRLRAASVAPARQPACLDFRPFFRPAPRQAPAPCVPAASPGPRGPVPKDRQRAFAVPPAPAVCDPSKSSRSCCSCRHASVHLFQVICAGPCCPGVAVQIRCAGRGLHGHCRMPGMHPVQTGLADPAAHVWRCGIRIELLALTDYMIANRRASRS